ncbi:NADH-cytochrome b5 reductase 2 [Erysiphe neolycopersici]|uniref:NADH-cytochrome b5 reductase 2 n=1 Tax=Erysiphe neolycopersici TaxID=212602 RepID=A0A420I3D3_9PEZI|nr:NADH-cytochrome b5 reductase 2 [Erysiphe neolycopersici]
MISSKPYLRPFSNLISCQDFTIMRFWQRVRKPWSIEKVIQVTSNSYIDISGRTLNKNICNKISSRGYHLVHRNSNHDQKEKSTPNSKRYIKLLLASLSFFVSGWLIVDNNVLQNQHAIFNPTKFTTFEVIKKEKISPTAFLLTLRSPRKYQGLYDPDPFEKWWAKGIWSVEAKQPELQIARLYTPLPPLRGEPLDYITFLIRKEYRGEMTGYLDRLQQNSTIQLRGPYQELEIPETVNKIIFLAGGTGISPALQIVHQFFERRSLEGIKPSIHIVWANRWRQDCQGGGIGKNENGARELNLSSHEENQSQNPIVKYLQKMQQLHPDQLTIQYLVDDEGTVVTPKTIEKLIGTDSERIPENCQSQTQSRLVLVSGPEGFIEFIAGAKKWAGPQGQGELGGILKNVDLKNWRVWKL